jgi:hypothetical protein
MEQFLNEIQEERNMLHEKVQVSEAQLLNMSRMVGAKPSQEEMDKVVGPLNRQIADLV